KLARNTGVVHRGGEVDGVRLLSPQPIDRIFDLQCNGIDLVIVGPKRASTPSAAPVPPNGARGAASPRLPDSSRPSAKQPAWTPGGRGLDDLHALRLRTGTMWPADSGRTAPGSMIGRRGGTGEAVSGPSGKAPDDAGDLSSRSTWGEPEWGLTCLDRT